MFNRKTTKGMTDAEFVAEIYVGLLEIPTEHLQDFFEETDVRMKNNLTQEGYKFFSEIKTYVINKRMKEALN